MTALAEALLAAQRQAVAALSKRYLANRDDDATDASAALSEALDAIGCTDTVEQGYLLTALEYLRQLGVQLATNGAAPKPSPETEPATDAQMKLVAKLCDEKKAVAPNAPLTKAQAHRVIDELKAGTYNADQWFPF